MVREDDLDIELIEQQFSDRSTFEGRLATADAERIAVERIDEEARPRLRVVPRHPFPLEALPAQAAEYADQLVRGGLPLEYVGPSILAALSTAVGGRVKLEVADGMWPERAVVWVALVGQSGTVKSPAIAYVLRAIEDLEKPASERYQRDLAAWRDLPKPQRDRTPKPVRSRLLVGDSTIEALAKILEHNPGGLLLRADELSGLVKGLGQYKKNGGADRSHLLSIWSSSPLSMDRIEGETYVHCPVVSILGGIQPARLALLDGDDGLAARWLYSAYPDDDIELEDFTSIRKAADDWRDLLRTIIQTRTAERTIVLIDEEQDYFKAVKRRLNKTRREESGLVRLWAAKGASHFLRLALVLAQSKNPNSGCIGKEAMEWADDLLHFFIDQVKALPDKSENLMLPRYQRDQDEAVDKLAEFCRQRSEHRATRREIQRAAVAAARTGTDVDRLIQRYAETHPGCVTDIGSSKLVYAPQFGPE